MGNIYRYIFPNHRTTTTNINETIMANIYRYMLPNDRTTPTNIHKSIMANIYRYILANDRTTQLQGKIGVYHRWSNDSLSWSPREPYLLSRPSDEVTHLDNKIALKCAIILCIILAVMHSTNKWTHIINKVKKIISYQTNIK